MIQLRTMTSWFLGSLGMVMIGVAVVVTPSNAFADAGSDCVSNNNCSLLSGVALGNCVGPCCANSTDPNCCSEACNGDPDCLSSCQSFYAAPCNGMMCSSFCYTFQLPPCTPNTSFCMQTTDKTSCGGCLCAPKGGASCQCQ